MSEAVQDSVGLAPRDAVLPAYRPARPEVPIDLWLAGNEGRPPVAFDLDVPPEALARYPDAAPLEASIAAKYGVDPDKVLVTAGADDGLLRVMLGYLGPGRRLALPEPTFSMIERYARLSGGEVVGLRWRPGASFPTDAILGSAPDVVAVVSPNNPTGGVATAEDLVRLRAGLPDALIVLDHAYAEFADEDLTHTALELGGTVVLRTLSKAYGCAGLRVGFALGDATVIAALRAAGNPYPCSATSLAGAEARLGADIAPQVRRVREERERLASRLTELGLRVPTSQSNFVYAEGPRTALDRLTDGLAGLGIAVRRFGGTDPAVRITCPSDARDFARLERALDAALAPEALLFDMDGVLAEVSDSYRAAIAATAATFGVSLDRSEIERAKAAGDANDDWRLTWNLVRAAGVDASLEEVTERFELLYQGTRDAPGLRETESLLVPRDVLERLRGRFRLGIVTGRPRTDATFFLERFGLADLFDVCVTREDAPLKPDPAPTRAAVARLGVESAWLLGDTPDDVRSARAAGVVPVGVTGPRPTPRTLDALRRSGAALLVDNASRIVEVLR